MIKWKHFIMTSVLLALNSVSVLADDREILRMPEIPTLEYPTTFYAIAIYDEDRKVVFAVDTLNHKIIVGEGMQASDVAKKVIDALRPYAHLCKR